MSQHILLLTPPFTQLNTPYPATAYLKGFLNTKNIAAYQADLGIEVTNLIFSTAGLTHLFSQPFNVTLFNANSKRILSLKNHYIDTIAPTIAFLQGKNNVLAHKICQRYYLPEASRFTQLDDIQIQFGQMGLHDKAMHLATLYLEDIADFIKDTTDPHFGFSRYAEKLARSAHTFDELHHALLQGNTYIDTILLNVLQQKMEHCSPDLVCFSVPFPGNVYTAFRCAQWLKNNFPTVKVAMGGGFPNTELRSLSDKRVFDFFDFITLDDGEAPLELLIKYVRQEIALHQLKRTFVLLHDVVTFINDTSSPDYKQGEVGTPDYSDFLLNQYISAIEIANPMHSLWSNGRWNKLTMAHGCYWGKCTFCDISLDYIKQYEPITASLLCDRMETIIAQTGDSGFHFVDEAAPPALMKAMSIEILKRKLNVTWWANIRFDKSFTRDTCLLLKHAGCIAVSGGLEVASDRLLKLIDKGITVSQVAKVNQHFTQAGIMVHAYLMYGFPTQTAQETIDSLEMVRQLFETGVLQSGFWHLFTMTAHSPVGLNPEKYQVQKVSNQIGTFANNDIEHIDPTGAKHDTFSFGLKKSLLNYMHGKCFDYPLQQWFDFKVPTTKVAANYISAIINEPEIPLHAQHTKVIWLGNDPTVTFTTKSKKGNVWHIGELCFENNRETLTIKMDKEKAIWFLAILEKLKNGITLLTLQEIKQDYEKNGFEDFELFWDNKPINTLYQVGLLMV